MFTKFKRNPNIYNAKNLSSYPIWTIAITPHINKTSLSFFIDCENIHPRCFVFKNFIACLTTFSKLDKMIQINVFFSFAKTQLGAIIYQFMIKYCLWLLMPKWGFKILRLLCSFLIKMHLESLLKYVLVIATNCAVKTQENLIVALHWVPLR